jgi:hypothetical protein
MPYNDMLIQCDLQSDDRFLIRIHGAGFLPTQAKIHLVKISRQTIQHVRDRYQRRIRTMHELAAKGQLTSPIDYDELWTLGRQVLGLLPGEVYGRLLRGLEKSRSQGSHHSLRIILEVSYAARALLDIPWELLVVPVDRLAEQQSILTRFLCLNANVVFIRQVRRAGYEQAMSIDPLLAVQVLTAQPHQYPIETPFFREHLATAIKQPLETWWYEGTDTLKALRERLTTTNPEIVQLICHGQENDTGMGMRSDMILTHDDGFAHRISAFDLEPVLTLASNLKVLILSVCNSSGRESVDSRLVSNIAFELVRSGIPMVIGMQGDIAQAAAALFSEALYASLRAKRSIYQALTDARIAVYSQGWVVDWSIVTVYQAHAYRESLPWHLRLIRRLDYDIFHPQRLRGIRGMVVASMILVVMSSLIRLINGRHDPEAERDLMIVGSRTWGIAGLVLPGLIGLMMRTESASLALSPHDVGRIRRAHYSGAYLGYALGGWTGGIVLATLFYTLGAAVPQTLWQILHVALLLWSIIFSAVIAHSQARQAHQWLGEHGDLFAYSSLIWIYLAAMILCFVIPGVLSVNGLANLLGPLAQPGVGGIIVALLVLRMILSLDS